MLTPDQKSTTLFKHFLGVGDTRAAREFFEEPIKSAFVVRPECLWTYGDHIPTGDEVSGGTTALQAIRDLSIASPVFSWKKSESETIPIVKKWTGLVLTKIDNGTPNAFALVGPDGKQLRNIIPFNFCEDVYNFSLRRDDGRKIPFGVGDWVLDVFSGILTFYGAVPAGVSPEHPPVMDFFQYVGGTGFRQDTFGLDGAILPIKDFNIPSGVFTVTSPALDLAITNSAESVEPNFVATYGYDGADKNEGVALSFEKYIPLKYASSLDVVKGFDDSKNSEVVTLLSRKRSIAAGKFTIEFTSQGAPVGASELVVDGTPETPLVSISHGGKSGSVTSLGTLTKVLFPDGKSFLVIKASEPVSPGDRVSFATIDATATTLGLFYWAQGKHTFLPYTTKESGYFDFGFPVTCANGKIPPSILIGSTSYGDYTDIITPDYYGSKMHGITIALEGSDGEKSADYVVKNTSGFYLDDILEQVKKERPGYSGVIYLRNGGYLVSKSMVDLSPFAGVSIQGEDSLLTIIQGANAVASFASTDTKSFALSNLSLVGMSVTIDTSSASLVAIRDIYAPAASLTIKQGANAVVVRGSTFNEVTAINRDGYAGGIDTQNLADTDTYHTLIASSAIKNADIDICHAHVIESSIGTLFLRKGNSLARANTIATLAVKAHGALINGNDISAYGASIAQNEIPSQGAFPIFGSEGTKYRKYATFSDPLTYDETQDHIAIKLDAAVLTVVNGVLTTCLTADKIGLTSTDYARPATAVDPVTKQVIPVAATTLQEALKDLYSHKADLVSGRVPLAQLPDSVAYGGLLFKGMWSFETNDGKYPVFGDMTVLPEEVGFIKEIQPGWFMIVSASTEAGNPAKPQTAVDGTIYTAGDWLLWNGAAFEKVDKAYQDAAYAILPINDPDGKPWGWKKEGDGFLDLGQTTITEAFDRVNELLQKITPRQPIHITQAHLNPITDAVQRKLKPAAGGPSIDSYDLSTSLSAYRIPLSLDIGDDFQKLVYYGESATLTGYIDGVAVGSLSLDTKEDATGKVSGSLTVIKEADPMKNEIMGAGLWKGIIAAIVPTTDLAEGSHTFTLGITDSQPLPKVNGALAKSIHLHMPYIPNEVAFDILSHNDTELTEAALNGSCSGIPMLKPGFRVNTGFTLKRAFKRYVRDDDQIVDVGDNLSGVWEPISGVVLSPNVQDPTYTDARVSTLFRVFNSCPAVMEKFHIKARIHNTDYQTAKEVTLRELKRRVDPSVELGRVCSGAGDTLYPLYDKDTQGACGALWNPRAGLRYEYSSELMRIGRNITLPDGSTSIVSEYQSPHGKYAFGELAEDVIDYSDLTGVEIPALGNKKYRWVTLERFDGKEVYLKEASGFTLNFNVAHDRLSSWVADDLTGETSGLLVFVKVLGVTGWIDANKAFDGFKTPALDGDAGMFAGSSTATSKRVSFGRTPRSGKLLVRVGILDDSGLAFSDLSVPKVV